MAPMIPALGAPPDSLDYNYSPNNQQARVDILTASAELSISAAP